MAKTEKIDCGELLIKHLNKHDKNQRWLAKMLDIPEGTISTWTQKKDIKVSNINKICNAIGIELWQFFAPDDLVLPEYTFEQKQFFAALVDMPPELQIKALDVLNAYHDAYIAGKEDRFR